MDVVVAYAVDRLSRNQNHIGVLFDEVDQAGAQLQFLTEKFEDTATGRFILLRRVQPDCKRTQPRGSNRVQWRQMAPVNYPTHAYE